MASKYNRDMIICGLNKYYEENEKIPVIRELKYIHYLPTDVHIFIKIFGSYQQALKDAGLYELRKDKYQFNRIEYSEKFLLEKLQLLINKLNGKLPTHIEINEDLDTPHTSSYDKYFSGIIPAFERLGYNIDEYKNRLKEEIELNMINSIKELAFILKKTPTSRDIDKYRKKYDYGYSAKTYSEHFGSIRNVYKIAGLKDTTPNKNKTKEEMILDLQFIAKELCRNIYIKDLEMFKNVSSASTYWAVFGSWNKALLQAGLELNRKIRITQNGTTCYSRYEYVIACILEKLKIEFVKETKYKNIIPSYQGNKRFDFVININNKQYFVEIFGITGSELYEQGKKEKIQLCKDNNIPLITFYPEDFWGKKNKDIINNLYTQIDQLESLPLEEVFSFLFK